MDDSTTHPRLGTDDWSPSLLDRYAEEFAAYGFERRILAAQQEFSSRALGETYRGNPYGFGGMPAGTAARLYGLIRTSRPLRVVETGVCNGVSSMIILRALAVNGQGDLASIDLPEFTDTDYDDGTFWDGKLGAVVPRDRQPGWLVPEELRTRWELTLGRSQEVLPPLLRRLGTIDFFLHDSEHSPECMRFEYESAWEYLRPGGVLASDDVTWNSAFEDFARQVKRAPSFATPNLAFVIR